VLQGKSIAADRGAAADHFQSLDLLRAGEILSQDRMRKEFPIPIQKYPYLHRLVTAAASASNSSSGVETNWGRTSKFIKSRSNVGFGTLSSVYTLPNATTMQLDMRSIEEDDLSFRVGLEIARLPGWPKFYDAEKTLRDAMHADTKHDQVAKKGPGFWTQTNLDGSYRGKKSGNPTVKDKNAVLNKTLGICKLIGFESDADQVDGFRKQLGLQPKSRVPRRRQQPPPPAPAARDAGEAGGDDGGDGVVDAGGAGEDDAGDGVVDAGGAGEDDAGDGVADAGGAGEDDGGDGVADAGGAGEDDGGDGVAGGDAEEASEDEESDDDDIEFDREIKFDDSTNPHSLEFLYGAFQGCTPNWGDITKITDRVWKPSSVNWQSVNAPKVARTPTDHLQKFINSFQLEAGLDAKMAFTVYPMCNDLRYVLRQDWSGLVVVNVESVSAPEGQDWSKTAKVRRVMQTEHALEECCPRANKCYNQSTKVVHLIRGDLQKFADTLEKCQTEQKPWTLGCYVYHESDVVEDVDIRELIGVVRCYPFSSAGAPEVNHFKAPYDEYQTAELIYIGPPFQQKIRKAQKSKS
jgi:hypothetical protein